MTPPIDPRTPSNKGAEIVVGLDWVGATLRGIGPHDLATSLASFVPTDWQEAGGGFGYTASLRGAGAGTVFFTPGRADVHVALPGRWCGSLTRTKSRRLLAVIDGMGGRVTRCDLAGTDRTRIVEPSAVAAAIDRGEHVTHARRLHFDHGLDATPGATVYVGAPSSRQQLLVYDKTAESEGRVEGVRWELRTRDVTADSMAEQLRQAQDWRGVWAGRVVGFIDFRDADGERSSWFARLVGCATKEPAYRPVPVRLLEEAERWLETQVAPTLAAVVAARGGDLQTVTDLLTSGRARWGPQHHALVAQGRVR